MAFPNYFVASNLSDLGRNMVMDADSQRQNDRMAAAQLQQAWQQQAEMARQAAQERQFNAELMFRQQGQQQGNAYQNALLELQKQQMTQMTPAQTAQDKFNYASLLNQLEIAREQAKIPSSQAEAARINQLGLNTRDWQISNENWEAERIASESKAARWNIRLKLLKDQLAQEEVGKAGEWFTTAGGAKTWAQKELPMRRAALIAELESIDKSPGTVAPDATGEMFMPIIRSRPASTNFSSGMQYGLPQSPAQVPPYNPLSQPPSGTSALTNAPSRQQALMQSIGSQPSGTPAIDPSRVGYQAEVRQLQEAARAGRIDRATYIALRQSVDAKYGVVQR